MHTEGIGRTLHREREAQRISLDAIARATMVRRDYLELIDNDELARLPAGAYAKGFIRAYATYLGLDPIPFVRAYETVCGQPAPELSAVVRQSVRVPNAAQPRAWRLAAGVAVFTLTMLGLLGIFRSGDDAAAPLRVSVEDVTKLSSPAPNPFRTAVVKVEAVDGDTWVRAVSDSDDEAFEGTLRRGDQRTFRGIERVDITVGNPGAVRIVANGKQMGTPPATNTYIATFTRDTVELPLVD